MKIHAPVSSPAAQAAPYTQTQPSPENAQPRTIAAPSTPNSHSHGDSSSDGVASMVHLHLEDETKMLNAISNMPVPANVLAERALGESSNLKLSDPYLPTQEEFVGTYNVAPGSGYVVESFTRDPKDVVLASEAGSDFDAIKAQADAQDPDNVGIAAYLTIRTSNVTLKDGILGSIIDSLPGDVMYILTVSNNGLVRFHLPPNRGIFSTLLFAYADSEKGAFTWLKNLWHAVFHGCYCFGLFFKGEPKDTTDSTKTQPVLMRYNRWAKGVAPYWAAVNTPQPPSQVKKQSPFSQEATLAA